MNSVYYNNDQRLGDFGLTALIATVIVPAAINLVSGFIDKQGQLKTLKAAESNVQKKAIIQAEIDNLQVKINEYNDMIARQDFSQLMGKGVLYGGIVVVSLVVGTMVFVKYRKRRKR